MTRIGGAGGLESKEGGQRVEWQLVGAWGRPRPQEGLQGLDQGYELRYHSVCQHKIPIKCGANSEKGKNLFCQQVVV